MTDLKEIRDLRRKTGLETYELIKNKRKLLAIEAERGNTERVMELSKELSYLGIAEKAMHNAYDNAFHDYEKHRSMSVGEKFGYAVCTVLIIFIVSAVWFSY